MIPERVRQLIDEWSGLAATLRGYGAEAQALAVGRCAEDLDHMIKADGVVTIPEAAKLSGYSQDHLRKLVKAGVIPDRGKPHAPRIAAADVPRKATGRRPKPAEPGLSLPAGLDARLAG